MSNNLALAQVAENQTSKELTINTALGQLDAALTEIRSCDVASGNVTLTTTQARSYVSFFVENATTAGRKLIFPALKKLSMVIADPDNTQDITVACGTTEVTVEAGKAVLIYTDGTANGLVSVSGGGGGASYPSFAGNAGKVLAVNITEDGVEWITDGGGSGLPSLTGNANRMLVVKADETGVEWIDAPAGSLPSITGEASKVLAVKADESGTEWIVPPGGTVVQDDILVNIAVDLNGSGTYTLPFTPTVGNWLVALTCINNSTYYSANAAQNWAAVGGGNDSVNSNLSLAAYYKKWGGSDTTTGVKPGNTTTNADGVVWVEIDGSKVTNLSTAIAYSEFITGSATPNFTGTTAATNGALAILGLFGRPYNIAFPSTTGDWTSSGTAENGTQNRQVRGYRQVYSGGSTIDPVITFNASSTSRGGSLLVINLPISTAATYPDLAGNQGKRLQVNQAGTGVEWKAAAEDIVTNATTAYTLQGPDRYVRMTSGSSNTVTVPPNSSVAYPVGTQITVLQAGAGSTTIAAGSGVTVNNAGAIGSQWGRRLLTKIATNTWDCI